MKICVYLRCPAGIDLYADNLRSEPRCERNVLAALSKCDWVTEIYTTGCGWTGGNAYTSKYKGNIPIAGRSDIILVMQDWGWLPPVHDYKGYIVNTYAGPWDTQVQEINNLSNRCGSRFVFTSGYPALFRDEERKNNLKKFLPAYYLLPEPRIIESRYANRFNKKTILFPQRMVLMSDITGNFYIKWAFQKLREDSSLNIRILTGCSKENVKDMFGTGLCEVSTEINQYFWANESIKPFMDVRDRVKLEYGLDWSCVMEIYAESKILAQPGIHYGGPPIEAAMYGVPFIGVHEKCGSLCECPDYLVSGGEEEVCAVFDRLMVDEEFYTKVAYSYNKYAVDTYSFEAYGNGLLNIIRGMGF